MGKYTMCMVYWIEILNSAWIERLNSVKMTILPKVVYRFNAIHIKILMIVFLQKWEKSF